MNPKKSYCRYFRPHLWKIGIAFLISIVMTISNFFSTHFLSVCVEKLTAPNLWKYISFVFILELVAKVASFSVSRVALVIKTNVIKELRWKLLKMISESSVESVRKNAPVDLAMITAEEANQYVDALHSIYNEAFNVLLGVAALVYTGFFSVELLLFLICSFMVILIVQFFSVKRMKNAQSIAREKTSTTKSLLVQVFEGFGDLKVQRLTKAIKQYIADVLLEEEKSNVNARKIMSANELLVGIMGSAMQVSFVFLASILVSSSKLSFGEFVALFMYRGYIYGLVGCIIRIVKFKSQADTATQRMNNLFENKKIVKEKWGTKQLKNPSGEIEMKNITVEYGETKILDNVSLTLPANSFIGIVGDSGSGKTTIVNVVAKVQTPTSGSIQMDGIELAELDEWSYRRAITMAPQVPFLFDFSIKQNLLLANPQASDESIWEALRQVAADKFVLEKGGLDVVISPKELSGGQRQRIALARIPLRGGKVVLLDESTSALDGESQAIVIETIRKAADMGHTMVLVAHRVSTLKSADMIVVMENGKVLETGTYNELYERSEKFRRLANLE